MAISQVSMKWGLSEAMQSKSDPDELLWNYIEAGKKPGERGDAECLDGADIPELKSLLALADTLQAALHADTPCDTGKESAERRLRQAIEQETESETRELPPAFAPSTPATRPNLTSGRGRSLFLTLLVALLIGSVIGYGVWRRHVAAHHATAAGSHPQRKPAAKQTGDH